MESVYSGVVSICSIHLILLIVNLNHLTINQTEDGNAYSEAYTKDNIYFLLKEISLLLVWKVMFLLYLKQNMGFDPYGLWWP